MEREWEQAKWAPTQGVRVGHYVSINSKGVIVMNKFTFEALNSPEAAFIFYDRVNSSLGIKYAHPRADDSYVIKKNGKDGAKQIRAGHAANQFNLHMTGTLRFQNPQIDDRGILILDLRNVAPVTNGRRGEKVKRKG